MLKFPYLIPAHFRIFLGLLLLTGLPRAFGQTADFYLQASQPKPSAIEPGIDSTAIISLGTTDPGFNSSVDLSCAITPVETTNPPICTVSPSTATPPSTPSLTFTTTGQTPPAPYTVTITGVSGGQTASVTLNTITVLPIAPGYSITIGTALSPSTVPAGSGATGLLTISSEADYSGSVTPGCSSITPEVEPSPICSFNPATVTITNGAAASTTLTISTTGTTTNGTTTTASRHTPSRILCALLLPFPFIVIVGFGGDAKRNRKLLSFFFLLMMIGGLVILPACNATTTVNNGTTTPKNTYTFTINAYDQNGVAATASTSALTVSLTVD